MKRFIKKVIELVDVGVPISWCHFNDGVLAACDEVCWKKRRSKGDTWCWNKEVKEAVLRKKEANMAICQNSIEENKRKYKE